MTNKIKIKFLVPILLLQFFALAILGIVGYRFGSMILKHQAESEFERTINTVYSSIENELQRRVTSIQKLAADPLFIKFSSAPYYKADVDADVFNFMKGNGLEFGEPQIGGPVNYTVGLLANEGNKKIVSDGIFPSEEYVGTDGIVKQHVYLGGSSDADFEPGSRANLKRSNTEWFKTAMEGKIYVGPPSPSKLFLREYQPISIENRPLEIEKKLVTIAVPHRIGDSIRGVLMVTTTPDFVDEAVPNEYGRYLLLVLSADDEKIAEIGDLKIESSIPGLGEKNVGPWPVGIGDDLIMKKTSPLSGWTVLVAGTKESIFGEVYSLRNNTFAIMVISIALMGVIVFFIINKLLSPILSLTRASDRIAKGELGVVIPRASEDEIGHLTDSFNKMSVSTKEMHDELEKQNIRLARINQIRRQILAIISHELRTPLAGVVGFYDLLKDDEGTSKAIKLDPEFSDNFGRLGESIDRCMEMVDRLTKTTRVMAGEIRSADEALEVTHLGEAITEIAEVTKRRSIERGIDLVYTKGIEANVACPSNALKLMLEEAISNAVKYSPDGEAVEIEIEIINDFAKISVKDKGPGISKDYFDDVIEPFFEVQDANYHSTDRFKFGAGGLGLGLTIISSILRSYQGSLKIESEEGKGTTIMMTLPVIIS